MSALISRNQACRDRIHAASESQSGCRPPDVAAATLTLKNVPLPNIVVGWADPEGRVHKPHLLWLLEDSVPLQSKTPGAGRFAGLYYGVLRGLTHALLSLGADPDGLFNAHRHKNPLSPAWDRRVLADEPYSLETLRRHVDVTIKSLALRDAAARRGISEASKPDHPDPEVVAGSNRLFRTLSLIARKRVAAFKATGAGEGGFVEVLVKEARQLAAEFADDRRLSERGLLKLAESVACWTWTKYKPRQSRRMTADGDELTARHAAGGRKTAARRRLQSEELIVRAAIEIRNNGCRPTQTAVLKAVYPQISGKRTIGRHWPAVLKALANGETSEARS